MDVRDVLEIVVRVGNIYRRRVPLLQGRWTGRSGNIRTNDPRPFVNVTVDNFALFLNIQGRAKVEEYPSES